MLSRLKMTTKTEGTAITLCPHHLGLGPLRDTSEALYLIFIMVCRNAKYDTTKQSYICPLFTVRAAIVIV